MNSLQPHGIQEPRGITDDQSTVEVVLRLCPVAAFGNRLRAVRIQGAAFENAANVGMRLKFLKPHVGVQPWIVIVEPNNESNRHTSVGHVVDESATELLIA